MRLFKKRREPTPAYEPPEAVRAERAGVLPQDGTATVGGVALPAGRRVNAFEGPVDAVLWRTDATPDDAVALWSQLAAVFPSTGLWPVLLAPAQELELSVGENWPAQAAIEPLVALRTLWDEAYGGDDEFASRIDAFPGLGRGGARRDAVGETIAALEPIEALALVPVTRPADVIAALGWMGPFNHTNDMGLLAAVLRSWEERYDAIVVGLTFDTLHLAVRRLPEGDDDALKAAWEAYIFCPDMVEQGADTVEALALGLAASPTWIFWWD